MFGDFSTEKPEDVLDAKTNQTFIADSMFFFPVSESSLCDVTYVDIVPMITLNVARHSNPRGTGFWKLNTSHLSEMRYVQEIKTQLKAL